MDYDENQEVRQRKKKYSKKGESVPSDNLGFRPQTHADIIDPRNIKRSQLRGRKKYTPKSTKENFMARLRIIIDVTDLPTDTESHLFKVTKKSQWTYVKKVLYRSREKIFCSICLEENIVAPQITYCGHIYCFHCILMHFTKSPNCILCPICKQLADKTELKTCEPKYDQQLKVNDEIVFNLKLRQGQYVYDAQTLSEDSNSTYVIRMRTKGIIPIFDQQLQQIKQELAKTSATDRAYHYLMEAMKIATQKLERITEKSNQHTHINLRENETMKENVISRFILAENEKFCHHFYQEKSGNLIFLHKMCKKYLGYDKQRPMFSIKSTILQKQEIDLSTQESEYKELALLNAGCEADAVIIDLSKLTDPQNNRKFRNELEQFIRQKQKNQQEQEVQLEKLRCEYEAEQAYLRQLKQQQQSKYYFDVKLPPTLEPSDFNENSFPSLMSSKSQEQSSGVNTREQPEVPGTISKSKTEVVGGSGKKFDLHEEKESFPGLGEVAYNKSEDAKMNKGGRKKKKKEKFVDMTHEIFSAREEPEQI